MPAATPAQFFEGYNPPGAGAVPNLENISQVQTKDAEKMPQLDRDYAIARGEGIDAGLRGRADDQGYLEQYYRNAANRAYAPILEGQGGYSASERDQIVRNQELQGLAYDPSMTQDLQLTGEEQAAIKGDPYKATEWFDPEWNDAIVTDQGQFMRDAVNDTSGNLRGTIDPSKLTMDEGVAEGIAAGVDQTGANVRGAIDRDKLALSQDFVKNYWMTPEQEQAIVSAAGRDVGSRTRAAVGDLEAAAAASGNASPLSISAARSRLENDSAANAADAMANARIAASRERADREAGIEDRRLDAEGRYAGLRSGAEMDLGREGTDTALRTEGMRLGAEQDLSRNRQGVEGAIGDARLSTERDVGDRKLSMAQWNQQEGAQQWTQAGDRASDRAAAVATNRQGVTQYGQDQQWQRGTGINDRLSGRNTQVADAKRADEQEARGFLTKQQGQASENVNTANDQRIKNYGTQTGAMSSATDTAAQYDLARRGQSFGTNFKSNLGRGLANNLAG